MADLSSFNRLFEVALTSARERGEPDWHLQQRRTAFDRFAAAGLPSMRNESWKYTNVQPVSDGHYVLPDESFNAEGQELPVPREDELQIVFINGVLSRARSQFGAHDGVTIKPIFDAMVNGESGSLQALMERSPMPASGVFGDLQTAFLSNGALVRIAPHADLKRRIHVLCLQTRVSPGVLSAPRLVVQAGESSRASIVQSHVGVLDAAGLTNAAVDLQLEPNAELSFCKVQSEGGDVFHFSHVNAVQQRDSRLNLFDFSIGGRLARNNVYVRLNGEHAETTMHGVYAVRGRQHVDHHTTIDHAQPRCHSHQTYKGILDEKARAVFDGRIIVRPGAMLTDAIQLNRNLLLSRDARIDTKPQLEIENDDVKCTHGATIGQIDEAQLFYLQSRGVGREDGVAMLSRGFVEDVIFRLADKVLRDSLRAVLGTYFEREDSLA